MFFDEFDTFISLEFSVDGWSDHSIDVAIAIVEDFAADDWQALHEAIGHRDAAWRTKLAQALGSVWSDTALSLLCLLLDTTDTEVFVAAADSLREFDCLDSAQLDVEELKRRYAALESTGRLDDLVVAEFFRLL